MKVSLSDLQSDDSAVYVCCSPVVRVVRGQVCLPSPECFERIYAMPRQSAAEQEQAGERMAAFAAAMAQARSEAKVSQRELGRMVHRKQGSISRYEAGLLEPDPETVFRIERALKVEPGVLSHHLGYLPIQSTSPYAKLVQSLLPVVDAIQDDPTLSPQARSMLISAYRAAAIERASQQRNDGEAPLNDGQASPPGGDAPPGKRTHSGSLPRSWRP